MSVSHHELREALGAYVLGGLEPDEQAAVDRHLDDCERCRQEIEDLRELPPLLDRLRPDEAASAADLRPRGDAQAALEVARGEHQRLRRAVWRWRAAAAAAVLAVVAVLVPLPDGGRVFAPQAAAADAAATQGRVTVTEQPWGMRVALDVAGLPERDGYSLWAVDTDEHRAMAASWSATDGGAVTLDGSCYMAAGEVTRFELVADDELLVTFEAAG